MLQKITYYERKSVNLKMLLSMIHPMRLMIPVMFLLGFLSVRAQVYLDTAYSIEERLEDLLGQMTLEEKVGQMTQAQWQSVNPATDMETYFIGSLLNGGGGSPSNNTPEGWADLYDGFQEHALNTRLGIPYIYGTDAVHGHNNLYGAVIFPHNIGLGCTRNESLVEEAARMTAIEVSATGVDWTFGPCVTVPQNERWGRTYEGFSEDPQLVAQLGAAAIRGFQGNDLGDSVTILACAKHYVGDGGTTGGHDQGNTEVSEEVLRNIHLVPYISAIQDNVGSIMASYNSWNGEKLHGYEYLLTAVLKEELGFKGFIISDWGGIDQLPGDYISDIEVSINAGIDMVMVPSNYKSFINGLISLVNEGKVSVDRIDDANRRILTQKFKLGMFEAPYTNRSLLDKVGIPEHREVARQCVRESMVILKNKNRILPLSKDAGHIHVAGRSADNLGYQCGGWTISWQGGSGDITIGTTILEALEEVAHGEVSYNLAGYSADANGAEAAIAVIGESPYAEGNGDRAYLGFNQADIDAVQSLYNNGFKVVTIIISGRPLILDDIWHYSDAVIAAWLPGTEARGITDILFGDNEPTGKLSFTWPASMEQIPINFGDTIYEPFLSYGFGIDTFALPSADSPPQAYSAATDQAGSLIELSFDKPMEIPSTSLLGLTVNNAPVAVAYVDLKVADPNTLLITPARELTESDIIYISSDGGVTAADGSISGPFGLRVYNSIVQFLSIPGKIEAEDYFAMQGIQTEDCSDTGGGLNVGYIEEGDFMLYYADVAEEGLYHISYRVASQAKGGALKLQILQGDTYHDLNTISFEATGGWQEWITVRDTATLPAGRNTLRVLATSNGFNVNWIEFIAAGGVFIENAESGIQIEVYPNPAEDILHIQSATDRPIGYVIYNAAGKELISGEFTTSLSLDLSGLSPGMHIVKFEVEEHLIFRKIVVR
jgi:beta-glucosidase